MSLNIKLRPFQEKAVDEYRTNWTKSISHLGIAPTAFGKSIFAGYMAHLLKGHGWRVVMLAHREALVDQNAKKALMVDPELRVAKEIAGERVGIGDGIDFISASIQTLRGKRAVDCCTNWKADGRKIFLIIDEAHHVLADSYLEFLETLAPDRILGLTATPFRGDGENIRTIFPEVAFNIPRGEMVDDGWLTRPHHFSVRTTTSLQGVKTKKGDYVVSELENKINVVDRNTLVANAADEAADILAAGHNQSVARAVCFTASVAHAHDMADLFRARGWEAYAIDGSTPIDERRQADIRLKTAESKVVLCSCGVLTEGWDVEEVNLGLFARPTKSAVLCEQMMGRCMRWLEAKPSVILVDFQDLYCEGRQTIAKPWNLPELWDSSGGDLRADEIWFRMKLESVNLSKQSLIWRCMNRPEVERIIGDETKHTGRTLNRAYLWWDLGQEYRMATNIGSVVIFLAPQGDYSAEWRSGQERVAIASGMDIDSVAMNAEMWLDMEYPTDAMFVRSRKERGAPPSEKQLAYLKKLGITTTTTLTRKEASQLINESQMKKNQSIEKGIVTFGKWAGSHATEIPVSYLRWALAPDQREWLGRRPEYAMFQAEAQRRGI